jgi:hypothetical protein
MPRVHEPDDALLVRGVELLDVGKFSVATIRRWVLNYGVS